MLSWVVLQFFFLLSGFQPWSGSIPLCACPPSMLTNRQQGSCFASSIKDLLPPVSLNAVEGQPGLTEHHVPSPVHDSLAFIFCKPSSLGELLSYVFSFYCWMVKQDDSISRRAVSKNHCLHPVVVPYWTMGSLAPAKCTAQALCSTAHPNSASNIWIPIRVPWTGQEESPGGKKKKSKEWGKKWEGRSQSRSPGWLSPWWVADLVCAALPAECKLGKVIFLLWVTGKAWLLSAGNPLARIKLLNVLTWEILCALDVMQVIGCNPVRTKSSQLVPLSAQAHRSKFGELAMIWILSFISNPRLSYIFMIGLAV